MMLWTALNLLFYVVMIAGVVFGYAMLRRIQQKQRTIDEQLARLLQASEEHKESEGSR